MSGSGRGLDDSLDLSVQVLEGSSKNTYNFKPFMLRSGSPISDESWLFRTFVSLPKGCVREVPYSIVFVLLRFRRDVVYPLV